MAYVKRRVKALLFHNSVFNKHGKGSAEDYSNDENDEADPHWLELLPQCLVRDQLLLLVIGVFITI